MTEILVWIAAILIAAISYFIGYRNGQRDPRVRIKRNVYDFQTKRRMK